jgi:uncharacterized membrane protein
MADTHEHVETSIVIEAHRDEVYERWTRFEEFPRFMKGVESVERVGPDRLRWKADIGFVEREWEADVTEQTPSVAVAWCADNAQRHDGRVTFQELAPNRTQVTLRMDYDPQGFVETAGAKLGAIASRIEGDLGRFKELVESEAR